ncbi:LOW QUALITY PROTEIN: Vacuolar fusion protein [Drechslerella dactyloides]|uniref:Vacuolar fusion protein n=1 Tax=Drechslerella dactyloides TaxID=74499 RepID=A0AAD6IY01_DREDA|nr:LOW QUALITY PROTEIN: Vacuolar fusion protein [Drechslerella dactyloides]
MQARDRDKQVSLICDEGRGSRGSLRPVVEKRCCTSQTGKSVNNGRSHANRRQPAANDDRRQVPREGTRQEQSPSIHQARARSSSFSCSSEMAAPAQTPTSITPASLSYLAIYNPSLGPTDETLPDQIVFWTSRAPVSQNECLRQIGLAQGIVEFSRGFSGSQDLNTVETQKSRIVLHEIEPGWWILASIDITQIHYATDPPTTDYSPREVAQPSVLIAQLKTSYRQFLLFNGTLESILLTHGRDYLLQRLEKFYTRWAWRWEVMLHGNPAVDIWNGIKIGRGVGDAEKEVLSDFVSRHRKEEDDSERLVDVIVSRFGKLSGVENGDKKTKPGFSSRGTGRLPGPDDGCIYRGVGNLAKESVRDISEWMARWYQYGDSSFDYQTVRPSRRKHRRHKSKGHSSQSSVPKLSTSGTPAPESSTPETAAGASESSTPGRIETSRTNSSEAESPGQPETTLPPPLLMEPGWQPPKPQTRIASKPADRRKPAKAVPEAGESNPIPEQQTNPRGSNNKLVLNVLTLGTYAAYSAWNRTREDQEQPKTAALESAPVVEPNPLETPGRFIIGYTGALDEEQEEEEATGDGQIERKDILSQTIWIERRHQQAEDNVQEVEESADKALALEECRLVAYAAYPFIFAMLFHPTNESLSKPGFYRLLNQQLGPLKGPLITSSENQYQPSHNKGLYDLIFDPATLTVHSSIPNIPDPMLAPTPPLLDTTEAGALPRIEALHIHSQVIRVIEDTRWKEIPLGTPSGERERTNRTTRGWWVAWMRLDSAEAQPKPPPTAAKRASSADAQVDRQELVPPEDDIASFIGSVSKQRRGRREAFIVKKGSDHRAHVRATKDSTGGFAIPIKLSGGLGIDTKRYFDQLLNLTART